MGARMRAVQIAFWQSAFGQSRFTQATLGRTAFGIAAALTLTSALALSCSSTGSGTIDDVKAIGGPIDAIEEEIVVKTSELHQFDMAAEDDVPEGTIEAVAPLVIDPSDVGGEYRIGAGDILSFRSYDDATLNEEVIVRYDGHISLPLIPDINVLDLSREDATERVREAYDEFFVDPQISLSVQSVTSKSYYVIGDVERPAEYPYIKPVTLLEAIYNAGGQRINTRAGDSFVGAQGQLVKAFVIRMVEGERTVYQYDLRDIAEPGVHASQAPIYPGDLIYVPEGVNLVYLIGEVRTPSVSQLTPNMTLVQLLSQTGGYVYQSARLREVIIMRAVDEENTLVMSVNLRKILHGNSPDIRMQAGDIVYIPVRRFFRLQTFVNQFTQSISPLLQLYNQVWDTWYTDERIDLLYNNDQFNQALNVGDVALLSQLLRDLQGFAPVPAAP